MSRLYLVLFLLISSSIFSQDFTKKYYEHAIKQRDIGDYVEAIEYFKKVLAVDSNSVNILWDYAEVLRLYKDYREAERIYQKVYNKEEARIHLRSIFYLGEMKKNNGKYEEAIETFKLAKKKYASDKEEYLYQKCVQELESCLWAKKAVKDSLEIKLVKLPPTINTSDSEFGHTILNSTLFFSSLKGDTTKINEEVIGNEYRTAIFKTEIENPKTIEKQKDISSAQLHVGNGSFSLDKKDIIIQFVKKSIVNCNAKL
jgi:tetratricopeptide (TPR) repeat protein